MLTSTHMLIGAGLLSRRRHTSKAIFAAWFGGFFPDMSVFIMVGISRILPPANGLWRAPDGLYWQQPWQTFSAISNSIPLYTALIALGILWSRHTKDSPDWGRMLALFAGAALLHVILDFPVHTNDAHVHFWPFSDWRFHSPVSYWQHDNYGEVVGVIETVIGVALAAWLIVRFPSWRVRLAAIACVVPYFIALSIFF